MSRSCRAVSEAVQHHEQGRRTRPRSVPAGSSPPTRAPGRWLQFTRLIYFERSNSQAIERICRERLVVRPGAIRSIATSGEAYLLGQAGSSSRAVACARTAGAPAPGLAMPRRTITSAWLCCLRGNARCSGRRAVSTRQHVCDYVTGGTASITNLGNALAADGRAVRRRTTSGKLCNSIPGRSAESALAVCRAALSGAVPR